MSRDIALASFDSAWSRIRATYYDTSFGGLDWNAVRDSMRPFAERAHTATELRAAIESLYVRLGESHFAIIPRELAAALPGRDEARDGGDPGHLGVEFRIVDDAVLVSRVEQGSAAERAGVRPGWELVRLGDLSVPPMLSAAGVARRERVRRAARLRVVLQANSRAFGEIGSAAELVVRAPGGVEHRLSVAREAWAGGVVRYGPLPPQHYRFEMRRLADERGCTGVIAFSVWMTPLLPQLERAIESLGTCRGIVLDLRGNTGGVAALVMGASGFFLTEPVSLGAMTTRAGTLRYMANPRFSNARGERVTPYAGPLAILIDEASASTTEIFAQGMHDIGRARLFGDSTAGEALPSTLSRLPNGDLLLHVIADFHSPKGARLEATGVVPDVLLPLRRADLLGGVDAPFAAALAWIARESRSATSAATRVPRLP